MLKIIFFTTLFAFLMFLSLSSVKSRTLLFWISLMLFFDSGGFFSGYLGGDIAWRIKYYDVFFGFMLIAYFLNKDSLRKPNHDLEFIKISRYFLLISLYFLLVTGIIVPLVKDYYNLPLFLQKNRLYFYAIPIFIMSYRFSLSSIYYFYRVLIAFSMLILLAFMITLLTPVNIVPIYTFNRYSEGDRISMISYGLIHWVLPMGMISLAIGRNLKLANTKYLILSFLLMLIAIFLTLTRREFLRVAFMALIIPFLLSLFNKSLYIKKYLKFIFPALGLIFLLSLMFPKYIDLSSRVMNDTFLLLYSGKDVQGVRDYRVTGSGDLELVKELIRANPFFGIGYYPAQWSNIMEMQKAGSRIALAIDAGGEVPIYGAVMTLGIIGLLVPFLLYWTIFIFWKQAYNHLRLYYTKLTSYPEELLLFITMMIFLLLKVTVEGYGLFGEFYNPYGFTNFTLLLGMSLGLFQKILILSARP